MTGYPIALAGWATRWRLPPEALAELATLMGAGDVPLGTPEHPGKAGLSEAYVQSEVRLDAARRGVRLDRNNVGAMEDETGRYVRFGLANDSPALNAKLKSGDLIGIRPVTITPAHVGCVIGQYVSRECKRRDWKYTGQGREPAQLAWATLINGLGGDARFATGAGTI